jgi:hypothetical protein
VLTGSGIGAEAVSRGDGATKRLKSGKEKRLKFGIEKLKFGIEKRLKSGIEKLKFDIEKRLKSGKELAVAAPMMAKADKDTIIAGTRREAPCCAASGCLSPWVSLSGVSATCVPYVSAQSQDFLAADQQNKSRRVDDPATTLARLPTQIRIKSWAYMVNDQLFSAVSRMRRSAAF